MHTMHRLHINIFHSFHRLQILTMSSHIDSKIEYRKVQGLVGEASFSIVLPKTYATNLGIGKGDFVKVSMNGTKMIVEKVGDG